MNDKSKLEQLKDELIESGKLVNKAGDKLISIIKINDLNDKLKKFNIYISKPGIKHNHSAAIAGIIKRNVIKRMKLPVETVNEHLEDYVGVLTKHIGIYNEYIQERINQKHLGIYKYPNEIIVMQYQTFFSNNEQAKENFDIIDEVKKKLILERNNGKATLFKVFFGERDNRTKETKIIKVIDADDLNFKSYFTSSEFTNNAKHVSDYYPAGIYHKDNVDSPDGKLQPKSNFKGEITVPVIPDFVIVDEPIIKQPTQQLKEEKQDDNNTEE